MKKLTQEEKNQIFIEKACKVHGDKYDYSKVEYIKSNKKVCIICPEHGEFWQIVNNHLRSAGCPKCKFAYVANLQRSNTESFIQKANLIHHNKYIYNKVEYKENNKTKVIITCPIHGDFEQTPHDHLSGYGCPKCKLKSQTKLFKELQNSFPKEEIIFETNSFDVPWLEGQRFDIYLPKYNIAIEYNGEQHYVPKQFFGGEIGFQDTLKRDELKRQKCIQNNCTLFEVKYNYNLQDLANLINDISKIIKNYENQSEKR